MTMLPPASWPCCPNCGAQMVMGLALGWSCPIGCTPPPAPGALTSKPSVFVNVEIPPGPHTIDAMVALADRVLDAYCAAVTKTKEMSADDRATLDAQAEAALAAIGYEKQDARRWMSERLAGGRRRR